MYQLVDQLHLKGHCSDTKQSNVTGPIRMYCVETKDVEVWSDRVMSRIDPVSRHVHMLRLTKSLPIEEHARRFVIVNWASAHQRGKIDTRARVSSLDNIKSAHCRGWHTFTLWQEQFHRGNYPTCQTVAVLEDLQEPGGRYLSCTCRISLLQLLTFRIIV
jgi:hypothetical protein